MQSTKSFYTEPFNLLIFATLLSLIFANSGLYPYYESILGFKFGFSIHVSHYIIPVYKSVLLWVNEGFMAIFFFSIILEIKHDFIFGSLNSIRKIMLPLFGAIGGMVLPAMIYISINYGNAISIDGWAIPVATDIAFTIGLLMLFKERVPPALRMLLISIAIIDDLGSIMIIAIYYTDQLNNVMIIASAFFVSLMMMANLAGIQSNKLYYLLSIGLWYCLVKSGVHATLAGVLCGLFIPLCDKSSDRNIRNIQRTIDPYVYKLLLPIFAFANAGVRLIDIDVTNLMDPIITGIVAGLVIGKPVGIFFFSWLAIQLGLARMPVNLNYSHILAVSIICGIGFTMSLFFGTLAFDEVGSQYSHFVRIGVLLGSTISAILGYLLLKTVLKERFYER
ncbi:MAG TPA: Na+/H+ antiporter NhaA [Gammaproteobacteria bacterium]|nr:Na+/H+ antiporter NhaA [Gammaproteobacteria bacterium]